MSVPTFWVFTASLAYFGLLSGYGFSVADEGAVIEQIERLADGERVYHDFHIGYAPGFYYLFALIMRAFGHSIVPVRLFLACVNSASVALAFYFASRVSGRRWAGVGSAFLCLGMFPVHPGIFSMSNTPYPTWCNMLVWLAGMCVLLRLRNDARIGRIVAAGFFAGLAFAFKPNVGLFQLAATSLAVLSIHSFLPRGSGRLRLLTPIVWWGLWFGIVGGVVWVFSAGAGVREYAIFVAPTFAAALCVAHRGLHVEPGLRTPHVFASAVALVGTFVAVNLPWLAYFYVDLGQARFLERVLFYKSGFEQFYFIGHGPMLVSVAGTFLVAVGLVYGPRILKALGLRPDIVLAAGLPLGALALLAATQVRTMPEGFYLAMNRPFEIFVPGVTVAAHWLGIGAWLVRVRAARDDEATYQLGVTVLAAVFLYLQMYPRADFAHWTGMMVMSGCLAFALVASASVDWLQVGKRTTRALAIATLVFGLCLFPAVRVGNVVAATFEPGILGRDVVYGQSPKMPVWMSVGAASWYADVNDLTSFVRENTVEDEQVFYFPALGTISFMADRRNPTRHVYFFPGWPGREVEAEVIADLRRTPPAFVVVGQYHQLFFSGAHNYYRGLSEHIAASYRPVARFGRFVVFRHNDLDVPDGLTVRGLLSFEDSAPRETVDYLRSGLMSDTAQTRRATLIRAARWRVASHSTLLLAALDDDDQSVRDQAVWAVRGTADEEVSCELLRGAIGARFSPRVNALAIRRGIRFAGEQCLDQVLELLRSTDEFVRNSGILAANNLMSRVLAQSFWFGGRFGLGPMESGVPVDELCTFEEIAAFVRTRDLNPVIRDLGLFLAARSSDPRAIDLLREAVEILELPKHRTLALWGLIERSDEPQFVDQALDLLGIEYALISQVAARAVRRAPDGDDRLAHFIRTKSGAQRVSALWLAATTGGPTTVRAAAELLTSASSLERAASAWMVGNRGGSSYSEELGALAQDSDPLVREMAVAGLEAMR